MLQPLKLSLNIVRNIGIAKGRKPYMWPDGIKYTGFTYYPRKPDFQDPPYEPLKLFRVKRIKPVKGTPYWERNILKELHLDEKSSAIAIVKNIPENNAKLWRIKHLIEISPITFPNGMPGKNSITLLKENGQLEIKHVAVSDERMKALENFKAKPTRMDGDTLRRRLRQNWNDGW